MSNLRTGEGPAVFPTLRAAFLAVVLIAGLGNLGAQAGISAGLSVELPNYERAYIAPSVSFTPLIDRGLEFEAGLAFGINVDEGQPHFIIPLWAGINLLFNEGSDFEPLLGLSLRPQLTFDASQFSFLLGPTIKGGFRLKVHPKAFWYLEAEQTLLFGAPRWINTGTKINTGINFRVDRQ